jgi:hemolysin activation/secretion protein
MRRGWGTLRTVALSALCTVSMSAIAGGLTLPDAVKPGAIRPGEQRPVHSRPPPAADVYQVPAVIDRPLDVDEGEKITVQRFELVGVVDRPEQGITLDELTALVESKRAERADGFTVGRLQEVAAAVTQHYRARGLILAQAFIPVQDVQDGVVKIEVLEGQLGRVLTEGNEYYSSKLLQSAFADLIDQPITKSEMESLLLTVTDFPGIGLFGVFQPGQEIGLSDLVLKVQEERKFELRLRADNHGLRETGQKRYRPELDLNNITRAGDVLRLAAQHSSNPDNAFYWRAEYERPLWFDPTYKFTVNYDENEFDVLGDFRDRDIFSSTKNLHAMVEKSFIRSRQSNLYASVDLGRKRALTKVRGRPVSQDDITAVTIAADYDMVDARFAGLNYVTAEFTHGFDDLFGSMGSAASAERTRVPPSRLGGSGGSREYAAGEFNKIFLSFQRLQALSILSEKLSRQSMLFRFEGLYSDDLLVPVEQFSIGGPTSVRAFQPTEALFDKGYFFSTEWIINAPLIADRPSPFGNRAWGELLRLHFFYDRAYGELNKHIRTENESQVYDGAGFAFTFDNPNAFNFTLSVAFPMGKPRPGNDKDPQAWVDFTWIY